jgi:hypothetical protein
VIGDRFTRADPSMTAGQASQLARRFEALAEELEEAEMHDEATVMARRATWWLAFSNNLTRLLPADD